MPTLYRWLCGVAVVFALFILLGGKWPGFGRHFLSVSSNFYGDLYEMSEVGHPAPIVQNVFSPTTTIDQSQIILFGDSFFKVSYDGPAVPVLLADALQQPVFTISDPGNNPLAYLQKIGYRKGSPKIMVVEMVERAFFEHIADYRVLTTQQLAATPAAATPAVLGPTKSAWFEGVWVDYFFKHNRFINPFRLVLKQLNYSLFGRIDRRIGKTSDNPPMLFYFEETIFGKRDLKPYADEGAMVVKGLEKVLHDDYNIFLVFVVIPNKYTIYHDLAGGTHNEFLPTLQKELEVRQVFSPDIYTLYRTYREMPDAELLYYPYDTHFSTVGKKIVVGALAHTISALQDELKKAATPSRARK